MSSESDEHGQRLLMLLLSTTPFEKGFITVVKEGQLRLVFIVTDVAVTYRSCPYANPPISFPLASALSPLVVRLLIVRRLGWVISVLSSCACSGRRRQEYREKLDLLAWYQRLLGTPAPPIPTGLG